MKRTPPIRGIAPLLMGLAALWAAPVTAQVRQQPVQQQPVQQQQGLQPQQQQLPAADSQVRLNVQLPPPDGREAECPDTGSFVVIGPTSRRGEPITAQAWNDCADLPRRTAPQPQIGIEIPLPTPQVRPRR